MKKHIAFITPYYAPAWAYGGPPKILHTLARNLVKNGVRVSVFTTDVCNEKRNPIRHEYIDGVEIFRIPVFSNMLAYKQKIFWSLQFARVFQTNLNTYDAVLFSDVRSLLNWSVFRLVKKHNIPYGIFAFGQIPYDKGWKNGIKKLFDTLWVREFITSAQWRFAQTEHERQMFVHHFGCSEKEIHILPLPIEVQHIPRIKKKREKTMIFVGRLHTLKGVDRLIQWSLPLLKADIELKFLIVGRDDGAESVLRGLVPFWAKDQVLFLGGVYDETLKKLYADSACFVFTPIYPEETSTAALEALACGLPVITNHNSEIPYLTEYKAGEYTETEQEFIRAVQRYISKSNSNETSTNCMKLIMDHFEESRVTKDLLHYIW